MNGPLEYLSHGKALCGKVFARFVETYNGLVDFCANLEGDGDVAGGDGRITVDRADPAHPVIRCSGRVTLAGTDNESVVCSGGKITFASAEDSNVVVKVSADDDGNLTVTIGVYYK